MFCTKCGEKIIDGHKFCMYCGSAVEEPVVVKTPVAVPNTYGDSNNINGSPTPYGATCIYPPCDTYVQPKADKKAKRIAARVLAIVCILIRLLFIAENIVASIQTYDPDSSMLCKIRCLAFAAEVVLLFAFLIRKKEGYSGLIAAVAWVGILFWAFVITVLFNLDTYTYANETLAVKIVDLALWFLTRPILWLFIGSLIKKPIEKIAAVLNLVGVIIYYAMIYVIYYDMESAVLSGLLLNVACEIPLVILLFIYPVLSKPIRKQK